MEMQATRVETRIGRNTLSIEAGKWNKTPPGPELPPDVVTNTAAKYREAVDRLTS